MKKFTILLIFAAIAQLSFSQTTYWSITYDAALPVGETKDHIENTSFRGIGVDGKKFINNNFALGGGIHWNVFYEKEDKVTTEFDNVTLTGTHFKYINSIPLYLNASYFLGFPGEFRPYASLNLGGIYSIYRTDIGLYRFEEDPLKFGIAPEIGFIVDAFLGAGLNVNFRYNYGFKTNDTDPLSYLGINIGLVWTK